MKVKGEAAIFIINIINIPISINILYFCQLKLSLIEIRLNSESLIKHFF
jgi:hypothetical protein